MLPYLAMLTAPRQASIIQYPPGKSSCFEAFGWEGLGFKSRWGLKIAFL